MRHINRRDFLKLGLLTSASVAAYPIAKALESKKSGSGHILLLVFDAWSAQNVNLYGYPRDTMPNLKKFSKTATIFHNHISAGRYTVPGTASLLSGLYPWSHRALNLGGRITAKHQDHLIFNVLDGNIDTVAYAQNVYADQIIGQAEEKLSQHIPFGAFNLNDRVIYDNPLFKKDQYAAFNAFEDGIIQDGKGADASLFLGPMIREKTLRDQTIAGFNHGAGYYNGLPESFESYSLAGLVDGLIDLVDGLTEPSFIYFHVYPPHDPYRPYYKFYNAFRDDGFSPATNPIHPLASEPRTKVVLNNNRLSYDAFLASWDAEMSRFFEYASQSGFLNQNTVIVTSDHGEMFDKGISGHMTTMLSQPILHIPLIIHNPGQTEQRDIYTFTSSTDVLPTIAAMVGVEQPAWTEGKILPMINESEDKSRIVYSFDAIHNPAFGALKNYSVSAIWDGLKICYYHLNDYENWELYDVLQDPVEHNELIAQGDKRQTIMKDILKAKLDEIGADLSGIG